MCRVRCFKRLHLLQEKQIHPKDKLLQIIQKYTEYIFLASPWQKIS
jgi:hypothetical protein